MFSFIGHNVQGFASELAASVAKRYPPALDGSPQKSPSVNRLTRIMEETCAKAVEYQKEHQLGWFAKARLGNAFRWELAERGYTKEFVDLATEALVVSLTKPKVGKGAAPASSDGGKPY
jgi:hypothetical protein